MSLQKKYEGTQGLKINMKYVELFSKQMISILRSKNKPCLVNDYEIELVIVMYMQQRGIRN